MDVLLTGYRDSENVFSKIYRNDGSNSFTETNIDLIGIYHGSATWGDLDNDGDLDILLSGNSLDGRISKIYRNDGSDTFTETNIDLTGVYYWNLPSI